MIVVYPVGVIGLYFYFLYHNRDAIMAMKAAKTEEKKRLKEQMEGRGHANSGDRDDEDVHKAADIGGRDHHRDHGGKGGDKHTHEDAASVAHAHGLTTAADANDLLAAPQSHEQHDDKGRHRGDKHRHGPIVSPAELTFLYLAYEGHVWYWEVVETARRLLLTAVVSVVGTGSAAQIVFGIIIAIVYVKLYGYFQPYELDEHDIMQEVAQYQVFA